MGTEMEINKDPHTKFYRMTSGSFIPGTGAAKTGCERIGENPINCKSSLLGNLLGADEWSLSCKFLATVFLGCSFST